MTSAAATRTGRLVPWLTAAAAGLVLAVALPGLGWWPLVPLAPLLLLEAIDSAGGAGGAALRGWLAGAVHWALTVSWVVPVMTHYGGLSAVAGVGCLLLMAAILGAGWAVVAAVTASVSPVWRPWIMATSWIAMEAMWRYQPWRFPWNQVAAAFASTPALLGSLPAWGAAGLGWATLMMGSGCWALLRPATRRSGATAISISIAAAVGMTLLAPSAELEDSEIVVGLIQPGTSLEERWNPSLWFETAESVMALTHQAAAEGAQLVLWPEGAIAYRIESDPTFRGRVVNLARDLHIEIVLNSIGATPDGGYANSAFLVTGDGVSPTRYDKVKLVPFGEYVPGWARILFTDSLVREVGSFEAGTEPTLLPAQVPLGIAICYEVVFPDLVAAEVREGAQLLVTLTNDGWYGDSWAPHQHMAQAVLRAVETRRTVARAALTGISGAVDPEGNVHGEIGVGGTGVSVVRVRPARGMTPRVRWGDWWTLVCLGITVIILGVGKIRRHSVL